MCCSVHWVADNGAIVVNRQRRRCVEALNGDTNCCRYTTAGAVKRATGFAFTTTFATPTSELSVPIVAVAGTCAMRIVHVGTLRIIRSLA